MTSAEELVAKLLACTFRFRHHSRERDTCELPVLVERSGRQPRCPWHDSDARPAGFNVKEELEKEIRRPNHWLEGAKLEMSDLRRLSGNGARMPNADLEGSQLDGAMLHKAILDDASLISTELPAATLSYASLSAPNWIALNCRVLISRTAISPERAFTALHLTARTSLASS